MGRQINKEKVLEEKGELKQYTLFKETKSDKLEWLLDAYKQDPYKARVLFFNSRPDCSIERDVCFERTDGSFEICCFRRTFSMTKTNRIYSREKKVKSLIYKNKKLYFKNGTSLKHAMYSDISCHFSFANDFLQERFAWLRNIKENKYCHNISLSSVITYKLFNADKVLKHLYKVPTAVIKVLTEDYNQINQDYGSNYISKFDWKRISPFLTNVENLKVTHFKNHLFRDAIEMAIKLDRKINCSWSDKRLKLEHDTWAKELRKIMLEFEPIIQLNPHKIFEDFEQFTGYNMLRTNHELIEEGHKQDHCVAGYGSSIASGYSGIYQVSGYTLEVSYRVDYYDKSNPNKKKLNYAQLRGLRNCSAPKELDDTVKSYITAFNNKYNFDEYENYLKTNKIVRSEYVNELPF